MRKKCFYRFLGLSRRGTLGCIFVVFLRETAECFARLSYNLSVRPYVCLSVRLSHYGAVS